MQGKKTGGREKGSVNKLTKTFKALLLDAIDALQDDPKANLVSWAQSNPTAFYSIAAKLIPQDLKAEVETSGEVIVKVIRENNTTGTSDTSSGTTTSA